MCMHVCVYVCVTGVDCMCACVLMGVRVRMTQLWQGQDDHEMITLLKDTHTGVLINRRRNNQLRGAPAKAKTSGFSGGTQAGTNPKCTVCTKTVYPTEYVSAGDHPFHKTCFRCNNKDCNRVMKSNDYCNVADKFYCPPCYKRLVMAAGGAGKEHDAATFGK